MFALLCGAASVPTGALAQNDLRNVPIGRLPRPGYEAVPLQWGPMLVLPELLVRATADDNVFATSTNPDDDVIFTVAPRIEASRRSANYNLIAQAYAQLDRYEEHSNENRDSFGGGITARYTFDRKHSAGLELRADRTHETREDPEANDNIDQPPAKINLLSGDISYQFRGGKFGLSPSAGLLRLDYKNPEEDAKDLTAYRFQLRTSYEVAPRIDAFVDGYLNLRDFRLPFDLGGVNRDSVTTGFDVGAAIDIADRWIGEIAIGAFHFDPEDESLSSFSGLGVNSTLTWRPRTRTAVTLSVFRGDVATVRLGAYGRVDTDASLTLNQEIRHNIIGRISSTIRDYTYKGITTREQTTYVQGAGIEYLINERASLVFDARFGEREATFSGDEFEATNFSIALRIRP